MEIMKHALTLYEAVTINAGGDPTQGEAEEIATIIAAEYDMTCSHVSERIAFLARHAGRRCPVSR
jgi:hypothetical protein